MDRWARAIGEVGVLPLMQSMDCITATEGTFEMLLAGGRTSAGTLEKRVQLDSVLLRSLLHQETDQVGVAQAVLHWPDVLRLQPGQRIEYTK